MIDNLLDIKERISLLVIGKVGQQHQEKELKKPIGHKVEEVIRTIEKPVLVVNQDFKAPKSALLAYDGSETSQKALQYMLNNVAFKNVKVHVVHSGAELSKSMTFMKDAQEQLIKAGIKTSTHFVDAKVEDAIQNYATKHNIDMMVMGAFGHHWVHEMVMGSFTRQMLTGCDRPLLLVR